MYSRQKLVYFDQHKYTRGACHSDFSYQFQIASSFAYGCNSKRSSFLGFKTTISSGDPLAYPVLPNFYSAYLMAACNTPFEYALKIPSFLIGLDFIYLIYALVLQFTSNHFAALLAIPLWMFTGGTGIFTYDKNAKDPSYEGVHTLWNGKENFWFQSMCHIFNPQRSAMFALPLLFVIFMCLIDGIKKYEWRFFVLAALLVGPIPQVQIHGYVTIAIWSISLCVVSFSFKFFTKYLLCWTLFGVIANVIAFPLLSPYLDRTTYQNNFMYISPIWQKSTYGTSFLNLWWRALGVFAMISFGPGLVAANSFQIKIYLASLNVLFLGCVIIFQPWDLDNTKILHDGWIPIALGIVSQYFVFVWNSTKIFFIRISVIILFLASIMSGVACFYFYETGLSPLADDSFLQPGLWIAENTPIDSIFLTPNAVLVSSSVYGGRQQLYGYMGWIMSHGLSNSTKRWARTHLLREQYGGEINYAFKTQYIYNDNRHKYDDPSPLSAQPWFSSVFAFSDVSVWKFHDDVNSRNAKESVLAIIPKPN